MKKTSVLTLTLFLFCFPLIGQENLGRMGGTITDETGAVIPGADVTARNEATGVEISVVSSDSGAYYFPTLVIGSYTVTASLTGFKTVEQVGVRVVSGGAVTLDITLPVGEVVDTVTVEGGALGVCAAENCPSRSIELGYGNNIPRLPAGSDFFAASISQGLVA